MTTVHQANLFKKTNVDYRVKISVPIRDMWRDGLIYCIIDIYGVTASDLHVQSEPMMHAIKRLGLDPARYQAWMFGDLKP